MSYQQEKAAYALVEAIDAFYKDYQPFDRPLTRFEFAEEETSMLECAQQIMEADGTEYLQCIILELSEIEADTGNNPATQSAARSMIDRIREYLNTDWLVQAAGQQEDPAQKSVFVLFAIGQLPAMPLRCEVFAKYIDAKYAMNMEYRKLMYACLDKEPDTDLSSCVLEAMQARFITPDPTKGIQWTISPCLLQEAETLSVFQKYKESLTNVLVEGPECSVKSPAAACPVGGSLVSANYDVRQGLLWYTLEEWPIGENIVSTASAEWCAARNEITSIGPEDADKRVKAELGITVDFLELHLEEDKR